MSTNGNSPHPFIPNTPSERVEMLATIGVGDFESLITDIPVQHRNPPLRLPDSASELEVATHLQALAALNADAGTQSVISRRWRISPLHPLDCRRHIATRRVRNFVHAVPTRSGTGSIAERI